jgi:hypothetical protein
VPAALSPKLQAPTTNSQPDPLSNLYFSKDSAALSSWANLPPSIKEAALKDFVCQSLNNPDFANLCKTLEGTWEALLLNPPTDQNPPSWAHGEMAQAVDAAE